MDWALIWTAIEAVSNWLYQPLLFWGIPLVPAIVLESWGSKSINSG